jgi:hypothetical protein
MYFRINFDMDLTKIDKSRIKEHSNGSKYANFTLYCDTEKVRDEYGNSGYVSHSLSKQDFDNKRNGIELPEMPIIGKAKVVYPKSDSAVEPQNTTPPAKADDSFDDDVPW